MERTEKHCAIWWRASPDRTAYWCLPDTTTIQSSPACDKYGILLMVMNEVMALDFGPTRTGKMAGTQHYGIKPDIVTCAKGITSGHCRVAGDRIGRRER